MITTIQPQTTQHNPAPTMQADRSREHYLVAESIRLELASTLLYTLEGMGAEVLGPLDPLEDGDVESTLRMLHYMKDYFESTRAGVERMIAQGRLEAAQRMSAQVAYNALLEEMQAPPVTPKPVAATPTPTPTPLSWPKSSTSRAGPLEVGEILVYSWGYEQTNIEFYQIISTTAKTIVMCEIKSQVTEDKKYMTADEMPLKDAFIGKPMRKKPYIWRDRICVNMDYGSCERWDGTPQHSSSYA
jgi:hypothetical protein